MGWSKDGVFWIYPYVPIKAVVPSKYRDSPLGFLLCLKLNKEKHVCIVDEYERILAKTAHFHRTVLEEQYSCTSNAGCGVMHKGQVFYHISAYTGPS